MEDQQEIKKPSTVYVKEIPPNIMDEITQEQSAYKLKMGVSINQSKAIIKMLRDYRECKRQNNFKSQYQ